MASKLEEDLAAAMVMVEDAVRGLIVAEMLESLPEIRALAVERAKELRTAQARLRSPEKALSAMDSEIAAAEKKLADIESQLDSGDASQRVDAKFLALGWADEIDSLREKREAFMTEEIEPLRKARDDAQWESEDAKARIEMLRINATKQNAFFALGRLTMAYRAYRFGSSALGTVITRGTDDPEFTEALDYLELLCRWSGFRTAGITREGEKYWEHQMDQMRAKANHYNPAEITATDIKAEPSYIEDYRSRGGMREGLAAFNSRN
jgi:hypothetical protein